jgi:peroxiredoxin
MKRKHNLAFDILSDPSNKVAGRFGIVHSLSEELQKLYLELDSDLTEFNGSEDWTLPLPARYIVDSDQIIQYARVNADYKNRPEPADTLNHLKAIRKSGAE